MRYALIAFFAFFVLAAPAAAQGDVPATVVAIVDVQRILQESLAAKSVQSRIEEQRSKFQTQVAVEEAELRTAEQKLAELRETEQAEAYGLAEQKLRERFLTVERQVQGRRKALDQAFSEAMNKVREGIIEIVQSIAKTRGVNLVIVKQQIIWHDKTIDMTQDVLDRLNRELPSIQIKILSDEEKITPKSR